METSSFLLRVLLDPYRRASLYLISIRRALPRCCNLRVPHPLGGSPYGADCKMWTLAASMQKHAEYNLTQPRQLLQLFRKMADKLWSPYHTANSLGSVLGCIDASDSDSKRILQQVCLRWHVGCTRETAALSSWLTKTTRRCRNGLRFHEAEETSADDRRKCETV